MSPVHKFMSSIPKPHIASNTTFQPLGRLALINNQINQASKSGLQSLGTSSTSTASYSTTAANKSTMTKQFITFADVVKDHKGKISAENPIDADEEWIKYGQDWPINEEKKKKEQEEGKKDSSKEDEKDSSSPSKKQKTTSSSKSSILTKINHDTTSLSSTKYTSLPFHSRQDLNEDTRIYTFTHPFPSTTSFHLGIGQHILCGFPLSSGEIVERPYAITRPTGADKEDGTIDIVVKVALPSEKDPGGTVSNILDGLKKERGDEMLIRGPEGPISYKGKGEFRIQSEKGEKTVKAKKVNFISGGTGMTPIYATIRHILETESDPVPIRFMDANKDISDILMHDNLAKLADEYEQFEIIHVLEEMPGESGEGKSGDAKDKDGKGKDGDIQGHPEKGLPDKPKFEKRLFPAEEGTISLVCGPPPMMDSAREGLCELGFVDEETFFHY